MDLPVEIGPHTFDITFQVLDIPAAYNFLLGRPWVHSAGAVPSSLHQSLKYIIRDHLVTVRAEEDLLVMQSSGIPFIDFENDLAPDSFHSIQVIPTTYVAEGTTIPKPRISDNSLMVAKVMIESGYPPGTGIGLAGPVKLKKTVDRYGLGPTKQNKKRIAAEKREKRLARLEGRDPVSPGLGEVPHISATFPKPAYVYQPQPFFFDEDEEEQYSEKVEELLVLAKKSRELKSVFEYDDIPEEVMCWAFSQSIQVATIQDSSVPQIHSAIRPAAPGERLKGWKITPFPRFRVRTLLVLP